MRRLWQVFYLTVIAVLLAVAFERRPRPVDDPATQLQTALILQTKNYGTVKWLGKPVWQPILDLWTLQETIFEVQPQLLIECGTYKGGSSYFFPQLFDLMERGRVITVDLEKQHDLSHPRATYLIGDCAAADRTTGPVMVVLDSDHSQRQVSRELEAYHGMVTLGSYVHVQDGVIDVLPTFAEDRPGPLGAIEAFLAEHDEFEADLERSQRFLITHHPKGWLRRKAAQALRATHGAADG